MAWLRRHRRLWAAKDPIFFRGGQENLYQYVKNSPVNFVDPSGRFVNNSCYWGCMTATVVSLLGLANSPCLFCLRLPAPANFYCVLGCTGVATGILVAAADDACTGLCKDKSNTCPL